MLADHRGADDLNSTLSDDQNDILRHTLTDQIVKDLLKEESAGEGNQALDEMMDE